MKLLLDQNLSPRLIDRLADLFPGSSHVSQVGLDRAFDRDVREFALANDYIIVTKDADFGELSVVLGFPPKVIWLRVGNCTTHRIEQLLRIGYAAIAALEGDSDIGVLALW
ncbi:MAG TPA: DUF5615 family PIN-like protein [Chloroflexota bacterium]